MSVWRGRLQARMGGEAPPSLFVDARHHPGAELWAGVRSWCEAFRAAGLAPGDRLVVGLPSGPALVAAVLAGLWEGLTLCPVDPATDPAVAAASYDPVAAVTAPAGMGRRPAPWAFTAGDLEPAAPPAALRPAGTYRTPDVRFLLPASSFDGWVALSDRNVEHLVGTLGDALHLSEPATRWLSLQPWWTPEGLLVDLLTPLLRAGEVVRLPGDLGGGASPGAWDAVTDLLNRWAPTHTALPVPVARALAQHWGGLGPLRSLLGGVVSGPGVDEVLAAHLASTTLRPLRGAPELSCLVTLGEPGVWRAGVLGRAAGCHLLVGDDGGYVVFGPNVCFGTWDGQALHVEPPDRGVKAYFR